MTSSNVNGQLPQLLEAKIPSESVAEKSESSRKSSKTSPLITETKMPSEPVAEESRSPLGKKTSSKTKTTSTANFVLPPVCANGAVDQLLSHAVRFAAARDFGSGTKLPFPKYFRTAKGATVPLEKLLDLSAVRKKFSSSRIVDDDEPTDDGSDSEETAHCHRDDKENYWWDDEILLPRPTTLVEGSEESVEAETLEKLRTSYRTQAKNVLSMLSKIKPTKLLDELVDVKLASLNLSRTDAETRGVCVERPDGERWRKFCDSLSRSEDESLKTLGKHCQGRDGRPVADLIKERLIPRTNERNESVVRPIYYVGDEDPPAELNDHFRTVLPRRDLEGDTKILQRLGIDTRGRNVVERYKDVLDLVDFYACQRMDSFVGNSLSTFTALQLIHRNGQGSWYNSGPIPLAKHLSIPVPIVYTYTGSSHPAGKVLLNISMRSVRAKLGREQPIHMLYHKTNDDKEFVDRLRGNRIITHDHRPEWTDTVESLRKNGDRKDSHLFAHKGNYLGTWQRIDIPLFVESEYALYLDADTLVNERFSFDDFGNDLFDSAIKFAQESENDPAPANAGVTLSNVPWLRRTFPQFLNFITQVADPDNRLSFSMPSDQGAYKDFYDPVRLDTRFNVKPYYARWFEYERTIVHFHGPKPHEFLKYFVGRGSSVDPLMTGLLARTDKEKDTLCDAALLFAKALRGDAALLSDYCAVNFGSDELLLRTCVIFFGDLPALKSSNGCDNVATALYRLEKRGRSIDGPRSLRGGGAHGARPHDGENDFFYDDLITLGLLWWLAMVAYALFRVGSFFFSMLTKRSVPAVFGDGNGNRRFSLPKKKGHHHDE